MAMLRNYGHFHFNWFYLVPESDSICSIKFVHWIGEHYSIAEDADTTYTPLHPPSSSTSMSTHRLMLIHLSYEYFNWSILCEYIRNITITDLPSNRENQNEEKKIRMFFISILREFTFPMNSRPTTRNPSLRSCYFSRSTIIETIDSNETYYDEITFSIGIRRT